MDQGVIKFYRNLLRNGFNNAGSIENPDIYLDSVGENLPICGKMGQDYVHIYLNIKDAKIAEIKYLCNCDPTANVVFEVMCSLLKDVKIVDFHNIKPSDFSAIVGSSEEDFLKRVKGSLELVDRGLNRFREGATVPSEP